MGSGFRGKEGGESGWKGKGSGSVDTSKKFDCEEMKEGGGGKGGVTFRQGSVHVMPFLRDRAGLRADGEGQCGGGS